MKSNKNHLKIIFVSDLELEEEVEVQKEPFIMSLEGPVLIYHVHSVQINCQRFPRFPKAHSLNLMWKLWNLWNFCDFRKFLHTLYLNSRIWKFSIFSPHWFQKLKRCTSLQERLIHIHDQRALVHYELHMLCLLQSTWVVLEITFSAAP